MWKRGLPCPWLHGTVPIREGQENGSNRPRALPTESTGRKPGGTTKHRAQAWWHQKAPGASPASTKHRAQAWWLRHRRALRQPAGLRPAAFCVRHEIGRASCREITKHRAQAWWHHKAPGASLVAAAAIRWRLPEPSIASGCDDSVAGRLDRAGFSSFGIL